jgi:hypothetical protein
MKKPIILILIALFFGVNTANAQFNKPLQSPNSKVNSSEAQYNIGIVGGLNTTRWFHSGGTKTAYRQPFNFGIVGGLSVERMLTKTTSISLEGYYAMRNLQLNYDVLNFPSQFNVNENFYRQFDVDYQEINVQAPFTYYFSKSNLRPYVFVGPRVSVPLSGKMIWQRTKIEEYGTANQHLSANGSSIDTVAFSAQNTWQWNLGVVAGAGIMYKLNVGNYYFLIKADVSAHASLAYFTFLKESPFVHASLLNSFTYEEQQGTSQNVIGAGYIDPYLLGMRFNTDAAVKITLMFPLKKQLQGACIRWGEYD